MALWTKGVKLSMGDTVSSGTPTYSELTGLIECPALGGSREKIDVTTLADDSYRYIGGLKSVEDLAFKFIYDNTSTGSFRTLSAVTGTKAWKVTFPDTTTFEFEGECSTAVMVQPLTVL